MVRNHVIRTERVETFRAIQDKLTPQSVEIPEVTNSSERSKNKVMKSISIMAVAILAAACVSALTAFSVSEAIHKKHEITRADDEAAAAFAADSLARLETIEELPPSGISAFIVADGGYLLTAASPLKKGGSLRAFAEGEGGGHALEVIGIDTITDLALLRFSDEDVASGAVPYRLAASASSIGESVYSLGFPADFLAYADGSISNSGPDGKVRVRLQSASVGAPVIGEKGQVAGILLNSNEEENEFFTLMPSDQIATWISETAGRHGLNVPLPSRNRLYYSNRSKQIELVRPFVYELKISY
jgi:S1-C subfamily serine protease